MLSLLSISNCVNFDPRLVAQSDPIAISLAALFYVRL